MSDTTAVPTIKIGTPAEFRTLVEELNKNLPADKRITVGDRGRLPMREVSKILITRQLQGKVTCVDTDYFPISKWALGETIGTRKSKGDINYLITYKIKGDDTSLSVTLTENEIRSFLPNVKGMISSAFATMAVALYLNAEESAAPLTVLTNYTVTDVKRVEIEQPQEALEEAPKTDDKGEQAPPADKAPETQEEAKEENKPARTRAAAAKTPAKPKAAKPKPATKELVSA